MIVLFTVYALVFFVMAAVLWKSLAQTVRMGLTTPMITLVVFAVLHGLSDVADVVLRLPGMDASPIGGVAAVRMIFLVASFLFLALYGVLALVESQDVRRVLFLMGMVVLVGFVAAITALFAEGAQVGTIIEAERATRAFVALPGGLLAALGLMRVGRTCLSLGMNKCYEGAVLAALGMAAYAVFAGAFATGYPVVYRLVGLPIQVYRMGSAAILTVGLVWMLERMSVRGDKAADER